MSKKVLIVEDEFIEANNLQIILERAGYTVSGIEPSVQEALNNISKDKPDIVLLDIFLQGDQTGIDLAKVFRRKGIAFVYLSANSNQETLDAAKSTRPYGFLVKPFRETDVLVTLDIAWYQHDQNQQDIFRKNSVPPDANDPAAERALKKMIGTSASMLEVLDHVQRVATTDISVLVLGESGTGKELVAQCIHHLSKRKDKPLITVNCAALPSTLIESELFGHEKGAFTGATDQRIGKFEQADKGTIFLDEIGELSLELQVKLLRVLQEKEIDRIGGKKTIPTDVRVIAATNRNLEKEMADGHFRIDLYYRLNVFPICLPPVRKRPEDILSLAQHFIDKSSKAMGKTVTGFSTRAEEKLLSYHWPGNIRELNNVIERSVLLADGPLIDNLTFLAMPQNNFTSSSQGKSDQVRTIDEIERDHILSVIQECRGKIAGKGGAAEALKMNTSTLNSRMKKLGIEKKFFLKQKQSEKG